MKAVQILMDERLIREADREAKRLHVDRSKLMRTALKQFLRELRTRSLEEQYRRGYESEVLPSEDEEVEQWENAQDWPKD
jgi:metal-responsive CopG/Arc/MetJ family transcriptional regulator